MYHLELRKFPHIACRFNQSEQQLRAIVVPWARQEWIEEGERKWNSNEAKLTVLEGAGLSMPELAMGKGWRNAQRRSEDVTERVLAQFAPDGGAGQAPGAQAAVAAPSQADGAPGGEEAPRDLRLLADSLGLEVLALLDQGAVAPVQVWRMAQERLGEPGRAGSVAEALALGERAVGSLLGRGLVVLFSGDGDGDGEAVAPDRQEAVLAAIETWAGGGPQQVVVARKS